MNTQLPLPLIEPDLFGFTTCDNQDVCQTGPQLRSDMLNVVKRVGHENHTYSYCDETCANHHSLEKLRGGL